MSGYIFDNAVERETEQRFGSLAALFDSRTKQLLGATGVGPGWRCLEIGAGGGSIAGWLADRVGQTGHVTATDIDPRFLAALDALGRPNVEVLRHDIVADPLPEGTYDLVHARLVFVHLPAAREALGRAAAALRPGGWLVIEDFDPDFIDRTFPTAGPTADPSDRALARRAFGALEEMLVARGSGSGWGSGLYQQFRALGLAEVGMEGQLSVQAGGSAGGRVFKANFAQVRDAAIATGRVTAAEIERMLALLDDPAFAFSMPVLFSAWGRRP